MRTIFISGIALLVMLFTSCSKDQDGETIGDTQTDSGSSAKETATAKSYYTSSGVTFKFRLYNRENDNNNNHTAEIYKIIESNNEISVIAQYSVPAIFMQFSGGFIGCRGDYVVAQSGGVGFNSIYLGNEFEIVNNHLVSYSYGSSMFGGTYGFVDGTFHNHSLNTHNGPYADKANQGYMFLLNGQYVMLSMGLNSNYGRPMLYKYDSATMKWTGSLVSQIDYGQDSYKDMNSTNHASKAGNSDKIFWAYLSYDYSPDNGRINIVSFNGTSFSPLTTLTGIGSVGKTLSNEYKHSISLHKNPNNLNNPYMVVKHYDSDILDIYKFTGSAIEVVKTGVTLPASIPITSGTMRTYKEIKFTGSNVYLIAGNDKNLYKLSGSTFVIDKANLTPEGEKISAIESTSTGLLASIVKNLSTKPQPKTVSDVILISN